MNITKKPFLMSFSGNPMRYQLSGASTAGTLSVVNIGFTAIDTRPNQAMTVTFLGEPRTFALKTDPATHNDLPVALDNETVSNWAHRVYYYLLQDTQLQEDYIMTIAAGGGGWEIILTARTASPAYDWGFGAHNINGVAVSTPTAGVAPEASTVEGVLVQVLKDGNEVIGEDYKPLDSSGTVKFDIGEYVHAKLLMAPPPRFNLSLQDGAIAYDDYFLKYLTAFFNRTAGVISQRGYSDPDNVFCYAIAGGLCREDLVENNQGSIDYFGLTAVKKRFMTWSPPSKLTDKFETHSLFFALQDQAYSTIQLKAILYTASNVGSTTNITSAIPALPWTVYEFMAGYAQLGLSQLMSGNVVKWELFLADENDTVISDVRSFELDEKYAENRRYFRFRNSWGTYDSLLCTGVFETVVEHEREKVIFMSDETETAYNSPGAYNMIKETQSFKANTGWLTRDYLNYLRDFMLSSDIYEVEDGRLYKCLLTSKKTSLLKDTNYSYSLAFEYERAYDGFFFHVSE